MTLIARARASLPEVEIEAEAPSVAWLVLRR
jgi:hypothetical protein